MRSSVALLSIYEAYLWFLPSLNITFDFNKVKTDVRTKRWFNVDSIILIENKATCTLFVNENNVRKVFRHLWISSNLTTTSHTKVMQESRDKIVLLLKHNPQIHIAILTVGLQPLAWKNHDYALVYTSKNLLSSLGFSAMSLTFPSHPASWGVSLRPLLNIRSQTEIMKQTSFRMASPLMLKRCWNLSLWVVQEQIKDCSTIPNCAVIV